MTLLIRVNNDGIRTNLPLDSFDHVKRNILRFKKTLSFVYRCVILSQLLQPHVVEEKNQKLELLLQRGL